MSRSRAPKVVELLRGKSAIKARKTIFYRGVTLIILTKSETRQDENLSYS